MPPPAGRDVSVGSVEVLGGADRTRAISGASDAAAAMEARRCGQLAKTIGKGSVQDGATCQ